jgi:hypothetical protein
MKITFLTIASAVLLVLGFSLTVSAGSIADVDLDLIPDVFDNCSVNPNGPNDALNQTDDDNDGFGTACDCDFVEGTPGEDPIVLGNDIADLFFFFNTTSALHDITGDGFVLGDDIAFCFGQFNGPPGPGATAQ